MSKALEDMPTNNLAIWLQKLAKNVSHATPGFRAAILREAAKRLVEYRQAEREREQ